MGSFTVQRKKKKKTEILQAEKDAVKRIIWKITKWKCKWAHIAARLIFGIDEGCVHWTSTQRMRNLMHYIILLHCDINSFSSFSRPVFLMRKKSKKNSVLFAYPFEDHETVEFLAINFTAANWMAINVGVSQKWNGIIYTIGHLLCTCNQVAEIGFEKFPHFEKIFFQSLHSENRVYFLTIFRTWLKAILQCTSL